MVKPILRDIRAVAGVTGVALLRKRDGYTEHIFPVAFTGEHSARLYETLAGVYRHLRGFSRLMLSFERVTIYLFNRPEFLLLMTTLPDLDQRMFNMVVNSKFAALDRALDTIPAAGKPGKGRPHEASTTGSPTEAILLAMNRLSDKLIQECGRAKVSRCWREARKPALTSYPLLWLLSVDANGHWAVRKGQQSASGAEASRALAELTDLFLEKLGPLQPLGREIFASIVDHDTERLEKSGFLHFLKASRPKRTPASRS